MNFLATIFVENKDFCQLFFFQFQNLERGYTRFFGIKIRKSYSLRIFEDTFMNNNILKNTKLNLLTERNKFYCLNKKQTLLSLINILQLVTTKCQKKRKKK